MSAVFAPSLNPFPFDLSGDSQVAKLRVPPHSIEAESSVLGGLLLDNGAWDRVGDLLVDNDFYRHEHKLIYAAIGALINASKPADVITVNEQLQNQGKPTLSTRKAKRSTAFWTKPSKKSSTSVKRALG
jgi:replicative DNA helicase